jgi:hypothetical protein
MTEKFVNATLRTLDNTSLAVKVRGYISPTLGWMLVPGSPEEHPDLIAFQNYLLEINDSPTEICLTKVARTLMEPSDYLSIDFRVSR